MQRICAKSLKVDGKLNKARTFTGCWACRLKKRRCDELKPTCSLCVRHGDTCSYDIRLMWLDVNMFKVDTSMSGGAEYVTFNESQQRRCNRFMISKTKKQGRTNNDKGKISKSKFKRLVFDAENQLSPPNSDGVEDEEQFKKSNNVQVKKSSTFTISVRRLKIYNNAVESVYGSNCNDYGQKKVNSKLNELLGNLDASMENMKKTNKSKSFFILKQGPFNAFPVIKEDELPDTPHSLNDLDVDINLATISNEILTKQEQSLVSLFDNEECADLTWIERVLWLNCQENMILKREEYSQWFLNYLQTAFSNKFIKMLTKLIDMTESLQYWLDAIINQWQNNSDWQAVAFTILVVLHGYDSCPQLTTELENWFMRLNKVNYSMYPLINFIIRNTESIDILYHCNRLLATNGILQDTYQDELTYELHVLVSDKLVTKWKDRVFEQLCSCEDTSHSCSQLKLSLIHI